MKSLIFSLVACLALIVAGSAFAQSPSGDTPTPPAAGTTPSPSTASATEPAAMSAVSQTVSGKVVSTTAADLTIMTDDGQRMVFTVDDPTKVPAGLAPDRRVRVEYKAQADGSYRAAAVTQIPITPSTRSDPSSGTQDAMPRTASLLPILALAGLLAIGLGIGIKAFSGRHRNAGA